jgi:glycosyltransferase involved in cell wall biosynthesis
LKKNVLFIAKTFPPAGGSAVQRPAKFVKYLPCHDWNPVVLTCRDHLLLRDESFLRDIPESVKVHRVTSAEPEYLDVLMEKKRNGQRGGLVNPVLKGLLKIYSMAYYRLAWIDWSMGWVPFGIRKGAQLIREENIDLIYVHAQPPSSVIIGHHLKKISGLPLVIDYDDPWSTLPFFESQPWYSVKLNRRLERKYLREADRVTYCKKSIYEGIAQTFTGLPPEKFQLIYNGYDPDDFPVTRSGRNGRPFRIVYTGKLARKFFYSPVSFLTALSQLIREKEVRPEEVEVIFAGLADRESLDLIDHLELTSVVRHVGYVSHRKSVELLLSADAILFMIENMEGKEVSKAYAGFIPAKIFECLYAKKPILAIVPPGPEYDMIREAGLGFFARPNDRDSVRGALRDLLRRHSGGSLAVTPDHDRIAAFDRRKLAEDLASAFNRVLETAPAGRDHSTPRNGRSQ